MPFQFSLRALLRLRKVQELREEMRLNLLHSSRGRLRAEHDEATRQKETEFETLERQLETGMSGAAFQLEEAFLQGVSSRSRELAAHLEALDLQVRKQVEVFWESQKKRKILDSLEEREWRVHQLIEDRREQQRVDDLFAQRQATRLDG